MVCNRPSRCSDHNKIFERHQQCLAPGLDTMTSAVAPSDLAKLAGTARAPLIIDVRGEQTFDAVNDMIAGAIRRSPDNIEQWHGELCERRPVVVYCVHGQEVSRGVALA